jgi:DNA-directed RNA polymerase, sigma subunit (sigma70/sigma32)
MEQILVAYYSNNAKKLHNTVDKILLKFGGISGKDVDDFYSLANEVFVDVMRRYDGAQSFDGFLYSCLLNKIKTEITRRNREKRKADRMSISIDTPIGDDENSTLGDVIADEFSIEKELFEKDEEGYSRRMSLYLNKLSNLQKEILRLNISGYLPGEIREELHISEKEYADCCSAIRSYKNTKCLAKLIRRKSVC